MTWFTVGSYNWMDANPSLNQCWITEPLRMNFNDILIKRQKVLLLLTVSENVQYAKWRPFRLGFKELHQPWLWFITGGYLVKRWFPPAAARARGQSNDLNREILASNLFNCCKEVINAPPVPSISRCIHIVYRHKNVSEYQWSNFIYNCMSTFLHYVHCKDALLDCSAPGGERCESLTRVDEIQCQRSCYDQCENRHDMKSSRGIKIERRDYRIHVCLTSLQNVCP